MIEWRVCDGCFRSKPRLIKIIQIILPMTKKFKKAHKTCHSHLFTLKPNAQQSLSTHAINLTLNFCSLNPQTSQDSQSQVKCLQAPVYNNDGSFASPAFILPGDKSYYVERRSKMLEDHQMRYQTYTDEKTQVNVAKPKSKNSFCNVCRQEYEDYLNHIESQLHKRKIAASPYSRHIQELTRTFQTHRAMRDTEREVKTLHGKTIIIETISDDSDEVQIISNPRKKITNTETTNPAKESVNQPYYPFSPWHPYLYSQNYQNQVGSFPLTFNFNLFINPINLNPPLSQLNPGIHPAGYGNFVVAHNYKMFDFKNLPPL